MELIYIGDDFYFETGTMMSEIYDTDGHRQDWGKVKVALRNGESIHIRPATPAERKPYIEMRDKIKSEMAQQNRRTQQ